MPNTSEIMQVNADGRLCNLTPSPTTEKNARPKTRAPYTGDAKSTKRRRARLQKEVAHKKCLQSIPTLQAYFNKLPKGSPATKKRPSRSCESLYTTSNNGRRRARLEVAAKKRKAIWARPANNNKQRRASKKTRGVVKKRRSCLDRKTSKAKRSAEARKTLQNKPAKSYLEDTMKAKLSTLEKIIRSGRRCNIVLSPVLKTMYKLILVCLYVSAHSYFIHHFTDAPTTCMTVGVFAKHIRNGARKRHNQHHASGLVDMHDCLSYAMSCVFTHLFVHSRQPCQSQANMESYEAFEKVFTNG